jgi:hypothetical protein
MARPVLLYHEHGDTANQKLIGTPMMTNTLSSRPGARQPVLLQVFHQSLKFR